MYDLGEQFHNKDLKKLCALDSCIFRGNNYRITILSERLVRLEYNNTGVFNDCETMIIKNRLFEMPNFNKKEDEKVLIIETPYFTLTYQKNNTFSSHSLVAKINDSKKEWFYGQKEVRNLGSFTFSLDEQYSLPKLEKGLFSFDGFVTLDDSDALSFDENGNVVQREIDKKNVDLYLFIYNKDFGLCLKDYFTLTGYPPLIPRYALGNWWSREYAYKDSDVLELITKFQRKKIPLSIFLLDNGWSKIDSKYPLLKSGFTFDENLFPNVIEFVAKIHELGIKLGVKINPQYGFSPIEKNYEIAQKYLPSDKNGLLSFNPCSVKNIDAFLKIFINPLISMGMDFFWNDYSENSPEKMYLLNYYMHKNVANSNVRSLILSRNSMYAAHLHNVIYSGHNPIDWNTLKYLPFYNLSSSNLGVSFQSHDVGGSIDGIEDSDFYLRSIQFGVFSPILRFNTEKGNYFKREPWKWDVVTESIATEYLRLRHKLIPYIYSESYNYYKQGTPLIKPFYYSNPLFYDDENYVNQYYFGSAFMISPITSPLDDMIGRTIQRFYIPSGFWYDFKTGKRFIGNHKYISFYEIDDYPIFVKKGSIIPMAGDNSYMSCDNPKDLEIHVFPGESNTYYLYEDDGITMNYEKNEYVKTEIDYNYRASNYTLIIRQVEGDSSFLPEYRDYKIVFRNTKKADKLVVYENNQIVNDIKTENSDSDFIVYIKHINTKNQLVINCYGQDIEIDNLRLIKDDINDIISDLKIRTIIKDDIAKIMFNDELSLGKKRIAIRKLKRKGLDPRSIKIFLRLLDYMEM